MFVYALPHNDNNGLPVMLVRSATETPNANSDLVRQSVRTRQHLCCHTPFRQPRGSRMPWTMAAISTVDGLTPHKTDPCTA